MLRLAIFLVFLSTPGFACDFCDPKVVLSKPLAECYLDRFETEIARMEDAGLPAQLINLASCEGVDSETRGGGVLPSIATPNDLVPVTSFLMDAAGMRCLAETLAAETWSPDLVQTFEVRRDCQTQ